jgi:hypothetical protein
VENGAFGKAPAPGVGAAPLQRRALGDIFNGAVKKVRAAAAAPSARAHARTCEHARARRHAFARGGLARPGARRGATP